MKLAPLFAQYLYIYKRLDLPGLGTFLLDPSTLLEPESNKSTKPVVLEGVTFESNPSVKDASELIAFIASETGKIKALAAADLESHLGFAHQFLNIGKPFLFEGIGNIVKIKSGVFAFTSGMAIPTSMQKYSLREISSTSSSEESFADIHPKKDKKKWKRPVVVLLMVAGLALAIWGGITVYNKTREEKKIPLPGDTTLQNNAMKSQAVTAVPPGNFKFILEKSNAARAMYRFDRLKIFKWPVQMETTDSVSYKIFMVLPVITADTTRILDSLSRLNGKKVYIEQ